MLWYSVHFSSKFARPLHQGCRSCTRWRDPMLTPLGCIIFMDPVVCQPSRRAVSGVPVRYIPACCSWSSVSGISPNPTAPPRKRSPRGARCHRPSRRELNSREDPGPGGGPSQSVGRPHIRRSNRELCQGGSIGSRGDKITFLTPSFGTPCCFHHPKYLCAQFSAKNRLINERIQRKS